MIAFEGTGTVEDKVLNEGTSIQSAKESGLVTAASIHIAINDAVSAAVEGSLVRIAGIANRSVVLILIESDVSCQLSADVSRACIYLLGKPFQFGGSTNLVNAVCIL